MNIVDKLREWQRGEREWDQGDMVREVLRVIVDQSSLISVLNHQIIELERGRITEARHD